MRSIMTMAALVAAAVPLAPAAAQTTSAYTVSAARLYAGPQRDYPGVRYVGRGVRVSLHGCLRDWSWCDVTYRSNRGWIVGSALRISYAGRRRNLAAKMGVGVISFSFGSYWDSYYRGRSFYGDRDRWQTQYQKGYRPEWGERDRDRRGDDRPGDDRPSDDRPGYNRPGDDHPRADRQRERPRSNAQLVPQQQIIRKAPQIRSHAPAMPGGGEHKAQGNVARPPHN